MRQEQHRLPTAIRRPDGEPFAFGGVGGLLKLVGADTRGQFAAAILPNIAPKTLGAPLHCHRNEDEYSYVLEGRVGVQLGEDVIEAGPGDLVFKPRGVAHAFWNAGDEPARLLEIISPAGFENYFRELAPLLAATERDEAAIGAVVSRYELDIEFESIPALAERHNLRLG